MTSEKKSPGRPTDSKSGPRPVIWICGGLIDNEVIIEPIMSPIYSNMPDLKSMSEQDLDSLYEKLRSFSKEEAIEIFKNKYAVDPSTVLEKSFLERRSDEAFIKQKKKAVEQQEFELTQVSKEAVFKSWKGVAYEIKDRKDLMFFIYGEPITSDGKKVHPPVSCAVPVSQLQFFELQEANSSTLE